MKSTNIGLWVFISFQGWRRVMCEHARRPRLFLETAAEYQARCDRLTPLFACRTKCMECARASRATLFSTMKAERATCDRQFFLTLTYDDKRLEALEGSTGAASSIEAAKKHVPPFFHRLRHWLDRRYVELIFRIGYFRIAEYGAERGRCHWHLLVFFRVEWRDAKRRENEARPMWDDDLLPNLRLDERYIHELESAEEARARTGRRNNSAFPSRIPWPWGFSYWQDCGGGEADYIAKYCTKSIQLWVDLRATTIKTAEQYRELERAAESAASRRRSPRLGHAFIRDVARRTAQQGLPARMAFQVPMGAKSIPGTRRLDGSDERRVLKVSTDRNTGQMWLREKVIPRMSVDFLLSGSASMAYIEEYDRVWEEVHGDAKQPCGPVTRTVTRNRHLKPIDETVPILATPEMARERLRKREDRRFIVRREREGLRRNRGLPVAAQKPVYGTVAEEDAVRFRRGFDATYDRAVQPVGVVHSKPTDIDGWVRHDYEALVTAWAGKFRREIINNIRGLDRFMQAQGLVGPWLRSQPALADWSVDAVETLLLRVILRLDPEVEAEWEKAAPRAVWRFWRQKTTLGRVSGMDQKKRPVTALPPLPGWQQFA